MKEKTKFVQYLGDTPIIRVLDFLITGRDFDYSLTDIATNSGIGWATLYRIFPKFIENQIVIQTRNIGNAKLFQLNSKNETVQKLVVLYKSILKMEQEILIEN
ncbi:hypothetical protein CL618_03800 [archaeon]|nr:hypothetical protein [archaeon]|tara:strand:+ start:1832 stop:2140 length:309 start_codon:yes stop_codon:yes gene_type:complete